MMPQRSRLAELLAVLAGGQVAAAIAILFTHWPESPLRALLAAIAVMAFVPLLFLLQFVLLLAASRGDPAPRPTLRELAGAWWAEVRELFPIFYWRVPLRWQAWPDRMGPEARGRTGVLLVHGFVCNRGFWQPWMRGLEARGIPFAAVNLEPVFGTIDAYAPLLDDACRRLAAATGRPPVLVGHSMGGLAIRAWLRTSPDAAVAHVITIGTPHGGTWLGRFAYSRNGRQMRLGSDWVRGLGVPPVDTPPFTCWYSNCDNIVFPPATATLPGADNRLVRGAAHVDLAFHPQVLAGSFALIEAAAR